MSLLQCCDRPSQAQLDGVREAVSQLRKGRPPPYELWCNDPFFSKVLAAFQYLVKCEVGQYGNDTQQSVFGKDAIRYKLQWVRRNLDQGDQVTYASFDDLFRCPWLMTSAEQRDVKTMVEKVLSRSTASSSQPNEEA